MCLFCAILFIWIFYVQYSRLRQRLVILCMRVKIGEAEALLSGLFQKDNDKSGRQAIGTGWKKNLQSVSGAVGFFIVYCTEWTRVFHPMFHRIHVQKQKRCTRMHDWFVHTKAFSTVNWRGGVQKVHALAEEYRAPIFHIQHSKQQQKIHKTLR